MKIREQRVLSAAGALWASMAFMGLVLPGCGGGEGQGNSTNTNNTNNTTAVCGNGEVDPGEECDEGADNSDLAPDACRTNCRSAHCGDGVVDTDEGCDQGTANSDLVPNACRTSCQPAGCGDGVVDTLTEPPEECDQGSANSDEEPGACRTSCQLPRCGDGVVDPGQICFGFHSMGVPRGFLAPADVDGDGLHELVGEMLGAKHAFQVISNSGGVLGLGVGHLSPRQFDPMVAAGPLVSGSSGDDVVVGGWRTVIATSDGQGGLRLPTAYVVDPQRSGSSAAPLVGVEVGGARYVLYLDIRQRFLCTVPVDDLGRFDLQGESCGQVSLPNGGPFGGMDQWSNARFLSLPTSPGVPPAVALFPNVGHAVLVFHLDTQGRFVSQDTYEAEPFPSHDMSLITLGFPSRQDGEGTPYLIEMRSPTGMDFDELRFRAWSPSSRAFASSVGAPVVGYGELTQVWFEMRLSFGDFGGSGDWLDMVLSNDGEPDPIPGLGLYRHFEAGGYMLSTSCLVPHGAAVLRGDGTTKDALVVALPAEGGNAARLEVYRDLGASGCTGMTPVEIPLPFPETHLGVADLDGDGLEELLVYKAGDPDQRLHGAAILWGGEDDLDLLTIGLVPASMVAFPHVVLARPADLLLSYRETSGGGDSAKNLLGLVRHEGDGYVTGLPIQAAGGPILEAITMGRWVEDLDDDGQADLLILDYDTGSARVFVGPYTAPQGFVSQATTPLPYLPGIAALGDVTGDNLPDLLLITGNPVAQPTIPDNRVTILENSGGAFDGGRLDLVTEFNPTLMVVADFNGDGWGDIATVHGAAGLVRVFLHSGSAGLDEHTFAEGQNYLAPGNALTLTALDLDADGHLDLLVCTPEHGMGPIFLRGRGDGTFHEAVDLSLSASEFAVYPARLTPGGHLDLVVVTATGLQSMEPVFSTTVITSTH